MICRVCKNDVSPSGFYASNKSSCKECVRLAVRRRARTNPAVQEYDRKRAKLPHRKAAAAKTRVRWRTAHPEGYRAQSKVSNSIRDGKLKKEPCVICGTTEHVHAHHQDYSKPLDVKWLCAKCHHRVHAAFPQLGGHYVQAT